MFTNSLSKTLKIFVAAAFVVTVAAAYSAQAADQGRPSDPRVYSSEWFENRLDATYNQGTGFNGAAVTPAYPSDPRPYSEGWHAMYDNSSQSPMNLSTSGLPARPSYPNSIGVRRPSDPTPYSPGWFAMRDFHAID